MNNSATDQSYNIYKAAGLIIQNRKVLATRTKGKNIFIYSARRQAGEGRIWDWRPNPRTARRIRNPYHWSERWEDRWYYAEAGGMPGQRHRLAAYLVKSFRGEITPENEVEEIRFFSSQLPENVEIASIFQHDILPILKARDSID